MRYNPMSLEGHSALVTGGSSGLGRATAVMLSQLGAKVMLIGRDQHRLSDAIADLEGEEHQAAVFDLSHADAIPAAMADWAKHFGGFTDVVHAAGVSQMKPIRVCREQDFHSIYQINVVAASQLLRGLTSAGVRTAADASFVVIGSAAGLVGVPGMPAYVTSKAALVGLVRTTALELARERVRVNAVLPGYCETHMASLNVVMRTAQQIEALTKAHPLGLGRPEDVAHAVAFLLSAAARWITGSCMVVDGGYSID